MDFISSTWTLPSKILPTKLFDLQLHSDEGMQDAEDGLTVLPEEPTEKKKFRKIPLIISIASTIFCVILFTAWFLNKGYKSFASTIAVVSIAVALLIVNTIMGIHAAFQIAHHKEHSPIVKFATTVPLPKFLADKDRRCDAEESLSLNADEDETMETAI